MIDKNQIIEHIEGLLGGQGSREMATRVFDQLEATGNHLTFDPQEGYKLARVDEQEWLDLLQRAEAPALRDQARQAIIDSVSEYAGYSHERGYYRLHVHRDGTVRWFEAADQHSDLIDAGAKHFQAVPSVGHTGTGSCACNCEYCNAVYNAADEALAAEEGREYRREDKYETRAHAISDAIGNSDLGDIEEMLCQALDEIEVGYFNDEKELPTRVIARWDAADWDDEKMVARRYRYEDADTGSAIELTEEEAGRYSWGRCDDNLTGGSQAGER